MGCDRDCTLVIASDKFRIMHTVVYRCVRHTKN